MKVELNVNATEIIAIFKKHMKFFSDLCLDDLRAEIQKELDSREFEQGAI